MAIFRGPGGAGDATADATNAASIAEGFADDSAASASAAAGSASTASTQATNAGNSATAAASSASAASTSATNAAASASTATTQATNASTSASNASTSETNAAASASTATTQAGNASTSATNAAASASTATTQATNAATSASNAASAQTAAEAALDSFDDRYLGPKTSDPALDNDGNALLTGALYFNSVSNIMKVYDGAAWNTVAITSAGLLVASNNLSDLTNTATARQNLDLEVGVDVQAFDATIVVDADIGVTVQAFDAGTSTASNTQTLTNKTINLVNNTVTVDGTDAVGFRNTPVNSQSADYTLVLADSGKTIFHPAADNTARTFTIPANSSVAYAVGTVLTFVNLAAADVTIAITTDTMYLAGPGTTGSRTLAEYGIASAVKLASTDWLISGNGLT
jgi:hypothetical protein